jgi:hypothetical protein
METHGFIDSERARDQERRRWHNAALAKAREIPSVAAEIDSLSEQLDQRKAVQRQLLEGADAEKRTLDYFEMAAFDDQQTVIEQLQRKVDEILRRAISPVNW